MKTDLPLILAALKGIAHSAPFDRPRHAARNSGATALKPRRVKTMFEVGQKVVCVDDDFSADTTEFHQLLPSKDEIYTVRDVMPGLDRDQSIATGQKQVTYAVLVEEIINPVPEGWHHEPAFASRRFAELQENTETGSIREEEPLEIYGGDYQP